ncbi:MAG: hypothetical protein EBR01_07920 [Proteobacteria bacterium]|nr:hypothetical protein [Pseudomonadota bacterium]
MVSKRRKILSLFVSVFSIVNVFFLAEWANLFGERTKDFIFITPTPFYNVYFAIFLTVLVIAFPLIGMACWFERKQLNSLNGFLHFVLGVSMLVPLNFIRETTGLFYKFPSLSKMTQFLVVNVFGSHKFITTGIVLISAAAICLRFNLRVVKAVRNIGVVLFPFSIFCIANLLFLVATNLNSDFVPYLHFRKFERPNPDSQKLLWIIFDELDYRLVFENRPKDLELPEIDRFKAEAINFNRAYSPSDRTINSIPSLLTGNRWTVIETGEVDYKLISTKPGLHEMKMTDLPSIFSEVKKMGLKSEVVGWYHNYCRLFKNDLNFCRRLPAGRFGYGATLHKSMSAILFRALNLDKRMERSYTFNYDQILQNSIWRIQSRDYSLLYLHFPIPHAPWIYDVNSKELSPWVSKVPANYFSNVKLVDKTLGDLRRALESVGDWKNVTVIATADHSWRESENYDGKRDLRIPFLVKMPDSQVSEVNFPVATIHTIDFIIQVLERKILTSEKLISWMREKNRTFPVGSLLMPFEDEIRYYNKIGKQNSIPVLHSSRIEINQTMSKN